MKPSRLFIAAQLSAQSIEQLSESVAEYRRLRNLSQLRWLPERNWHMTLRFLGDASAEQQDDLMAALPDCRPASLTTALSAIRLGGFPGEEKPVVLALQLRATRDWQSLVSNLERLARHLGFAAEPRTFRPHITVARFRKGSRRSCPSVSRDLTVEFRQLVLYRSHLDASGARYESLKSIRLSTS